LSGGATQTLADQLIRKSLENEGLSGSVRKETRIGEKSLLQRKRSEPEKVGGGGPEGGKESANQRRREGLTSQREERSTCENRGINEIKCAVDWEHSHEKSVKWGVYRRKGGGGRRHHRKVFDIIEKGRVLDKGGARDIKARRLANFQRENLRGKQYLGGGSPGQ